MKKTIFSALAVVAALSLPALADQTASGNLDSTVTQDQSLTVNAAVATNGGIVNTDDGTVTKTETSTEAERGGIANTAGGTVTKESNNTSVEAERGGIVADGNVTSRSGNTSVEAERGGIISKGNVISDSGNAEDGSIVAAGPVNSNKAEDGGIAANGDVRTTEIDDSFNKDETEITIGDVTVMVTTSDLSGQVEDNRIDLDTESIVTTGDINNKDSAFSGATGITVIKQNTGFNSLMQTSVNVNANVKK